MSDTKQRLTLKGGTCVQVEGHDAYLAGDTEVETTGEHFQALRAYSTTPLQEYPKVLADGRTVQGPEDEAPAPSGPLADVALNGAATNDGYVPDRDDPDTPKKPGSHRAHSSHGGEKKK